MGGIVNQNTPPRGLTLAKAAARVVAEDPRFAVTRATVHGIDLPVFAAAPANLRDYLVAARPAHGDGAAPYLTMGEQTWTYDAFLADVRACAAGLAARGIRPGDRVGLAMANRPEMLIGFMGIVSLGAVATFLNGWWTTTEMEFALGDSGAVLTLADPKRAARLAPIGAPVVTTDAWDSFLQPTDTWPENVIAPDDDFAVMYSSGSTGTPKGVVLTHRGAVNAVWTWLMSVIYGPMMLPPGDPAPDPGPPVFLVVTPLFHVTATHPVFLLSIGMGARVILMGKWDAAEAARLISTHRVTRFLGVPTQTADLRAYVAAEGLHLDSLEMLGSGGAKRPPADVTPLAETFPGVGVASGWGMTETNAAGATIVGDDYLARPDATGRLLPPLHEVEIRGDDGRALPPGAVGELAVKSPMNMRCYLNQPEATAKTLVDGWLLTGDLATLDAEGYLTILDRKKNIIIRGGENIAALEVEAALHHHPDVIEAGVFPVPDPRLGEVVGACLQVTPGADLTLEKVCTFLDDRLARFKHPARLWTRTAPLTRGATAKTDRRALARECLEENAP